MKLSEFAQRLEDYCELIEGMIYNQKIIEDNPAEIRKNIDKIKKYIIEHGDIDDIFEHEGVIKQILGLEI